MMMFLYKAPIINKVIFSVAFVIIASGLMQVCIEFWGSTLLGRLKNGILLLIFLWFNRHIFSSLDKWELGYIILMLIGFIAHLNIILDSHIDPFREMVNWVSMVVLLSLYRYNSFGKPILPLVVLVVFFFLETSIAIYERFTFSNIINFSENEFYSFEADTFSDDKGFRSRSLLFHPLTNANVLSIMMSFILVNRYMKKGMKFILLFMGLLALFSFNSRGAMLCWILILFFRFVLFNKSLVYTGFIILLAYLFLPPIFQIVQDTGILGRLDFDFSDSSSETRLLAFAIFAEQDWNIESILLGGKIITMPNSNLSLENGILLNLGYWGWIIGSLKLIYEIIISYKCLSSYPVKEKLLIMFAFWGVAFANNNVFSPVFFSFYILIFMASDIFNYMKSPKHLCT